MDYTAPPPIRVPQVTQEHVNEVSAALQWIADFRTLSTTSWYASSVRAN